MIPTPPIKLIVSNAPGGRGAASGPLGAGSVASAEITDNTTEQKLIAVKIGLNDANGNGILTRTDDFPWLSFVRSGIGTWYVGGLDDLSNSWGVRVNSSGSFFTINTAGLVTPGGDNVQDFGSASHRWKTIFAGTGTINTSDEREKQQVGAVPDEWLDAWGDVEWGRFKFDAAVALKGGTARWHIGLLAQHVRDAFAERDLDATTIGLLCYDEWEAAGDEEAGNRWGLRYEECFAMEAAYQRRRMDRIEARLVALEA